MLNEYNNAPSIHQDERGVCLRATDGVCYLIITNLPPGCLGLS